MIIALTGRAGSGKDTVAAIIQELYPDLNWQIKGFADKLRQVASLLTGIPADEMKKQEVKERFLTPEWNQIKTLENGNSYGLAMTVRDLLQRLGTDAVRDKLHPNSWVNALMREYDSINDKFKKSSFDLSNWHTPIAMASYERKSDKIQYKCYCGNTFLAKPIHVDHAHVKSCGCLQKKVASNAKTHGDSKSRLMSIYKNMKNRCLNKNSEVYQKYGAVGITICDEWISSYDNFKSWSLMNGYSDEMSIDRRENDKGYSPDNCRWIPMGDQSKNKEVYANNKLGIRGVSLTLNGKYKAQIQFEGKKVAIGTFATQEEASAAYEAKRTELFKIIEPIMASNNFLIADCRYLNELEAITSRGGICIRIVRPDNPYPKSNHESETSLDGVELLTIINDGNIEQLRLRVKEFFDPILKNLGK